MNAMFSRAGEHGNVLFLVLIAVILFAALSYAVTSSSRTQANKPKGIDTVGAAELNQYPATVRMATMSMRIEGTDVEALEFNPPANFSSLTSTDIGVFHPEGGGASYQAAASNLMASNNQGTWHFNAEFEIDNIGMNIGSDFAGNDIIAFLPGVRQGICTEINDKIDITTAVPNTNADFSTSYTKDMDDAYTSPSAEIIIGTAGSNGTGGLTGQPFGCFQNNGGEYVYYQVLLER